MTNLATHNDNIYSTGCTSHTLGYLSTLESDLPMVEKMGIWKLLAKKVGYLEGKFLATGRKLYSPS